MSPCLSRSFAALVAVIFALICSEVVASPPKHQDLDENYTFEQYLADFHKHYDAEEEYENRRRIFEENLAAILQHNRDSRYNYVMGVNHLTDSTARELPLGYNKNEARLRRSKNSISASAERTLQKTQNSRQTELPITIDPISELPDSVDWRSPSTSKTTVVTPVKDQGHCGSCWAFASTAVLESHIAIETGVLFTLSAQQLVSCAPNKQHCGGQGGCTGSTGELAFLYASQAGLLQEWQLGYESYEGDQMNCTLETEKDGGAFLRGTPMGRVKDVVATTVGYAKLPPNNYRTLMNAVAKMGPLVVSVSTAGWALYEGGVFENVDDSPSAFDINHAVVLVGYGTDETTGEDYWLIRNSWRPTWGEGGYIRLKRVDPDTLDDPDSICGMDVTPGDGNACEKDKDGKDIQPGPMKVCGTSGVLSDSSLPIGGRLA